MHELTHILGLNNQYYSQFYTTPTGTQKRTLSQVVASVGSSRSMIVTPYVTKYVQDYFTCGQSVGGLLEEEGGQGSAGSHWERKVYSDEMMTASDWSAGLRITGLTLSLLADTNFYQEVDLSLSEVAMWGRGRGCNFALGSVSTAPQFCPSSNSKGCDFYYRFMGYCSSSDPFGSGSIYKSAYSNGICGFPQYNTNSNSNYMTLGDGSRCWTSPQINGGLCYVSSCDSSGTRVSVTVAGSTAVCTSQGQVVSPGGLQLYCPNPTVFCSVKTCPNWCNNHGLCVKGTCICIEPWGGAACNIGCPKYYDTRTSTCVTSCDLATQYLFNGNTCVSACPSGYTGDAVTRQCKVCDILCQLLSSPYLGIHLWILLGLVLLLLLV